MASRVKYAAEGGFEGVLQKLKKMHSDNGSARLKRLIYYVERFRETVDYDSFKEKGYPIGSGEIESDQRYIPQKRLKTSGAEWHPDLINSILAFRNVRADGYWDDFWEERKDSQYAA